LNTDGTLASLGLPRVTVTLLRWADELAVRDERDPPRLGSWYTIAMQPSPTNDTDPRIEAVLVAGYRAMSASQKLARVTALTRTVQQLALLDIRRRHPNAAQRELDLRLASRWIEPALMKRAFDWDVQAAGF
jgi:hypothetical protein